MFFAKDFIETAEGLFFAVVTNTVEQGKVLCFLRYIEENNAFKKLDTCSANQFLQTHYPNYLYYSPQLQTQLHAVPIENIVKHHQPKQRLVTILHAKPENQIVQDLVILLNLLQQQAINLDHCGITGSLLIGAERDSSDLDLVCYDKATFQQGRAVLCKLIAKNQLQDLSPKDWQETYQRRDCELDFADYVWHEQRKLNKGMINGRKFDWSFLNTQATEFEQYEKFGAITLQATVIDDTDAFDYPAEFKIDHADINSVVSFTATYTGQAITGEIIEASGQIERNQHGSKRLVIGSSREAIGEYIKVLR